MHNQLQNIGYENHVAVKNLGSLGILMALYFVKVFLVMVILNKWIVFQLEVARNKNFKASIE
jgi:hypothetical protein